MTTAMATAPAPATNERRARLGSFIGTTIEWYDFYLYGTAAALVFPKLFFPSYSPLTGTLLALLTYSAGFIARPLGGIVMGHFGDRIGRKAMLVTSLMVMGVATTLIGVLPTFESIGVWAPILLLAMRIVQGFGVGGEWGGAVLVAVEHAPPTRRGLAGAWPQAGVPAGLLLANGVFMTLTMTLSDAAFMAWGWRVGFLGSAALIAVGLVIRLKMEETPDFRKAKEDGQIAKYPILEVFRTQWRQVLLAIGIKMSQNAIFYVITVFALTYITTVLHLPRSTALIGVLVASAVSLFTLLFAGHLSDLYGRRRVYLIGAVLSGAFAFPFFLLMDTKSSLLIWGSIVISLIFHDLMYGPQAAFMSELFEPELRYTGASVGYQTASLLAGGLSPVLAVLLLGLADNRPWPIALYMVGLSLITVLATVFSPETHRGNRCEGALGSADLHEENPATQTNAKATTSAVA
ncbi:MFS transporter [Mycolicibacterium sp. YH-1]|uniref:MFS transporter n=1 Tax=Mycolicibacterium sp. YH-1 TaxID=2908837 RepID=UPI001F4C027A|nr:MFS transporter [Mycolicibacterium sp. YH-1]UNB50412.1 MHS family MFS transporter [Mycolicibacterium sp. YH-1]